MASANSLGQIRRFLPGWLVATLAIALMFACLLGVFLFAYADSRSQAATVIALATDIAAMTPELPPTPTLPLPTASPTPVPLPASCTDVKDQDPEAADGVHTLYLGGDVNNPVTIYCHNMAEMPAAYLEFANSGDGFNYATTSYPGQELITSYTRIRLDLQTLVVDLADRTFATTTGALPDSGLITGNDYATAVGCNAGEAGTVFGQANIDLTGTPFAVAESVTFVVRGQESEGGEPEIGPDRKIINLAVGGRCGWIAPAGDLTLAYVP
jgi:hypothetical protein